MTCFSHETSFPQHAAPESNLRVAWDLSVECEQATQSSLLSKQQFTSSQRGPIPGPQQKQKTKRLTDRQQRFVDLQGLQARKPKSKCQPSCVSPKLLDRIFPRPFVIVMVSGDPGVGWHGAILFKVSSLFPEVNWLFCHKHSSGEPRFTLIQPDLILTET